MQCQPRNSSYTLSTNLGGETSFGRRQLEGIVGRRQARPQILLKPIDRKKMGSEWGTRYLRPLQLDLHSLCPSHPEQSFLSNLVCTIKSWTAGGSTHLSSTSIMIHPPPNREAARMCCLKGTPNDRHQSGGWWEGQRQLVVGSCGIGIP